jgi:hypothetical protein
MEVKMTTTTLERPATAAPDNSSPIMGEEVAAAIVAETSEAANPETGLEVGEPAPALSIADQVSGVVERLNAKAEADNAEGEGEAPAEPSTSQSLPSGKDAFDQLVEAAQRSWFAGRDAKYRALFDAAPLVKRALDNPHTWDAYRTDKGSKARTIEAQVFDVIVSVDPEASEISTTRRAVYAGVIGYFAFMCEGMGADEAIEALKGVPGIMEGAAELYRFAHPPHFPPQKGRKSRATGKRPGRSPVSGKKKTVAEAEPQFYTASDTARELPPTVKFGEEGEGAEGEEADAEGELDRLRQECRDAFETFMASDPDEGELHDLRDYLLAERRQAA